MKKISFFTSLFVISALCFSQEALKSVEEEYYDFLSLQGIVERPTLGYRTLSDSRWQFLPVEKITENEDGTFSKTVIPGNQADKNFWKNNNLGTIHILWESESQGINRFSSGFYHGIKAKVFGPEWFNSYNTAAPYGQNDGALWQGVGYNSSLTGGIRVEAFGFEGTFKPVVTFSQNKEFELMPSAYDNKYAYIWGYGGNKGIDLPQRFGDKSYFQFDWGDSEVRYTYHNFTVGFGTQSPWIGPAWLNPMLGSNNAGTYPKLDFGFRKTDIIVPKIGWNLGQFETRIWIGQLTESDYFDNDGKLDKNLLNGFNFSYSSSFIKGLTAGITKVCLTRWGNNFWRYINPFYSSNDITGIGEDQKASVYVDWVFQEAGFEFFAEIGVDDYTPNGIKGILNYPYDTMIYTLGLKKVFNHKSSPIIASELIFEWNAIEKNIHRASGISYYSYYFHAQIGQGYTNRGQLLGCGLGSTNSQYVSYKMYLKNYSVSLFLHHYNVDNDYAYLLWNNKGLYSYKANLAFGISGEYFIKPNFYVAYKFVDDFILNPHYKNTLETSEKLNNLHIEISLKYLF